MINAYILVIVQSGAADSVKKKLETAKEVQDISIVYGEYDIVMKVQVEEMNDLQSFIMTNIRTIKDVDRTSTMIALD